jgi:predicted AAA+ superfamily ATPase
MLRFTQAPHLLRETLLALPSEKRSHPIIIDEIQKVPELLNEIHLLIEREGFYFILCGSSARKLKTHSTNLLGGRAWVYHFYPLVYPEIPDFDLLKALRHGLLPKHYLSKPEFIQKYLESYVTVYLTDEIRNEGLVRNLAGFARFLELAGLCNTEMINMSNIARDCHVSRNTIEGYFQILIDTMLGYFIYPYHQKVKRDLLVSTPKFYFFDVGVANDLAKKEIVHLKDDAAGHSFEHFLLAYRSIKQKRFDIQYWRTKTGLEVDFILDDAEVAIEVKISTQVHAEDLRGIKAFCEEHPTTQTIVVSQDVAPRKLIINDELTITILPWRFFLEQLWSDVFPLG